MMLLIGMKVSLAHKWKFENCSWPAHEEEVVMQHYVDGCGALQSP